MERKGDRFEVFREGKLWYWRLIVSHSPSSAPAAISRSYPSRNTALRALEKVRQSIAHAQIEPIVIDS